MNKKPFKIIEEAKDNVRKGSTKMAISLLSDLFSEMKNELENEIILYSSRYEKVNKDLHSGLISNIEANNELLKINNSILYLIEKTKQKFEKNEGQQIIIKSKNEAELKILIKDVEKSIEHHLKLINKWSESIKFKDLNDKKLTSETYIDLDFYLTPSRLNLNLSQKRKNIRIDELVKTRDEHIIILGQPGAGKTTTIKKLVQSIIAKDFSLKFQFPILIRLRELNNDKNIDNAQDIIINRILNIVGIDLDVSFNESRLNKIDSVRKSIGLEENLKILWENDKELEPKFRAIASSSYNLKKLISENRSSMFRIFVTELIDSLNILILLDGFDELRPDLKQVIIEEYSRLSLSLNNSKLILTSRVGEIQRDIDNSIVFEICPLTNIQIKNFISKWLNKRVDAQNMYSQVLKSTFMDAALRPLTLAHLCAIYERYNKIPDKPKSIYDKMLNLLLEEWDSQRGIRRISKYSNFSIFEKKEFLSNLSYIFSSSFETSIFTRTQLTEAYKRIHQKFELSEREQKEVINELESHTGIFVQSSYNAYEFSHKSLQEFLTAEYLLKLPKLPNWNELSKLPNECALVVALSSDSTFYLCELVFNAIKYIIASSIEKCNIFIQTFLSRIILEKPVFNKNPYYAISIYYLFTFKILYFLDFSIEIFRNIFKRTDFLASFQMLNQFYEDTTNLNDLTPMEIFKYYPILDSEKIEDIVKRHSGGNNFIFVSLINRRTETDEYLPNFLIVDKKQWDKYKH